MGYAIDCFGMGIALTGKDLMKLGDRTLRKVVREFR